MSRGEREGFGFISTGGVLTLDWRLFSYVFLFVCLCFFFLFWTAGWEESTESCSGRRVNKNHIKKRGDESRYPSSLKTP